MTETMPTNFSTGLELIKILKGKYSDIGPHIGSKSRFPAALIFFSSQKEYQKFLEEAPWEFYRLSEIIASEQSLSAYQLNKWFDKALEKSKEKPLVLVPMTEFIRFHPNNTNIHIISKFFTQLVQSEKSKIIIPMLDFYSNYQNFIKEFSHKDRMAEIFSQCKIEDNENDDLEIFFDNLGIISSNKFDRISNIKDWMLLWETGNIAFKKKILIQNQKIIKIIQKVDISVPKVKKRLIDNFKDYLQYEYSIPQTSFNIDPPKEIQEFILSKITKFKGQKIWESFEMMILGEGKNFENQFYVYWEQSQREEKKIHRWFWLNKGKTVKLSNKALQDAIKNVNDPEKILDRIYLDGLQKNNIDNGILSARRELITKFSDPLFISDIATFEGYFIQMRNNLGHDPAQIIDRIIGFFDFERNTIVEIVPQLIRKQSGLSSDHFLILKMVWPEYAAYIEPALNPEPLGSFAIVEDFPTFARTYISQYILSKAVHDRQTEELEILQAEFRKQWKEINAGIITGKIQSHDNGILPSEIKDKKYVFLDGVGFEWNKLIQFLFEKSGWQILEVIPIFSPLPSTTDYFPLEKTEEGKTTEKFDDFDRMIHEPYEFPKTIEKEINKLKEIVEKKIHKKFNGYSHPMWIISDHGSTVFARKGNPLKSFKEEDKKHGGRYSKLTQMSFLETDGLKIISGEKKFIVSMTYDNLGKTCPRGEAHGGATPEEILAFAIKVAPPNIVKQISQILMKTEKMEYSPLDDSICILIEGKYEEKINEIKLSMNNSPGFSIDMQYYHQRTLLLPMALLLQKGLKAGKNQFIFTVNKRIRVSCEFTISSGSEKTDFDKKFGF
jgi:hypothetical protein